MRQRSFHPMYIKSHLQLAVPLVHQDALDAQSYSTDAGVQKATKGGLINRMLTFFMYLSDVPQGGETVFSACSGSLANRTAQPSQ